METSISIIICIIALVIVFFSALVYVKNKVKTSVFLAVLSILCMFSGLGINTQSIIGTMNDTYGEIIDEMELEIDNLMKPKKKEIPDIYYAEAEIVGHRTQDDGTYKIQFLVSQTNDVRDYEWYEIISDKEYDIMVPYLLTMSSNGTETTEDDKILVVWMDMN